MHVAAWQSGTWQHAHRSALEARGSKLNYATALERHPFLTRFLQRIRSTASPRKAGRCQTPESCIVRRINLLVECVIHRRKSILRASDNSRVLRSLKHIQSCPPYKEIRLNQTKHHVLQVVEVRLHWSKQRKCLRALSFPFLLEVLVSLSVLHT